MNTANVHLSTTVHFRNAGLSEPGCCVCHLDIRRRLELLVTHRST